MLETGAPAVEKQLEDFDVRNYVRNSKKGAEPVASSKSKTQEPKKRESNRKERNLQPQCHLSESAAVASL